jgi:uncharacterized repeat protein (TIGR04052 family)
MITQSLKNNADAIGGGTSAQKKELQGVLLTMAKQAVAAAAPAVGASAPASVPVVGTEDFNTVRATLASKLTTGTASQDVTVNFDVVNGATSIKACDAVTLTNLKRWDQTPLTATPAAAATLLASPSTTQSTAGQFVDIRFYVANVLLWDAAGNAVPLILTEAAKQSKNLALLDFGYNTAASGVAPSCATAYKTSITGKVVPGTYTGISFTVGVPVRSADLAAKLNHTNAADTLSPLPLQTTAMAWSWQSGRKFIKIDFQPDTAAKKFASGAVATAAVLNTHIGSTGCSGNPATGATETACTNANRLGIKFADFNAASQKIVLDVAKLLKDADLTYDGSGPGGCMSGTTDPECAPIFKALGLGFTGANGGRTLTGADAQTVFSVK